MKYFKLIMFSLVVSVMSLSGELVTRAALDIGSGATKLRVAVVDTETNRIEKILLDDQFAVDYQESLEQSKDGSFSDEVMQKGLHSIRMSSQMAKEHGAKKVVAIATAAFRNANNADSFMEQILKETGVEVYVIDQDLEGKLAYQAALSSMGVPEQGVIVWDIGGGSLQLTMKGAGDNYQIYRGHDASVPFKNWVIQGLQQKNIKDFTTPNPLNQSEISRAEQQARSLAQKVDHVFKNQIQKPSTKVYGVGSIFGIRMQDLVGKKNFTKAELEGHVKALAGKTDSDVGGGPFASVAISNPILILGFMNELGIDEVEIVDINNSDGAMIYASFWEESLPTLVRADRCEPARVQCYCN